MGVNHHASLLCGIRIEKQLIEKRIRLCEHEDKNTEFCAVCGRETWRSITEVKHADLWRLETDEEHDKWNSLHGCYRKRWHVINGFELYGKYIYIGTEIVEVEPAQGEASDLIPVSFPTETMSALLQHLREDKITYSVNDYGLYLVSWTH